MKRPLARRKQNMLLRICRGRSDHGHIALLRRSGSIDSAPLPACSACCARACRQTLASSDLSRVDRGSRPVHDIGCRTSPSRARMVSGRSLTMGATCSRPVLALRASPGSQSARYGRSAVEAHRRITGGAAKGAQRASIWTSVGHAPVARAATVWSARSRPVGSPMSAGRGER